MKDLVSSWVMGGFVGVLGLVGLVMASGARDDAIYGFGLGVAVLSLAAAYWLVRQPVLTLPPARRGRARSSRGLDPSPPSDGDSEPGSAGSPPG